ncbi:MAG: hypothetical protein NVS1B11_33900 [Terriglobales bacterium]
MVVICDQVMREISNYLDHEVEPGLRADIEQHLRGCKHCTAVLDGMRNVVQLYSDERMLEVPLGFGHRMHRRLEEGMSGNRRSFLGWMVAATAAVLVVGGFEAASSSVSSRPLRSEHARPAGKIPLAMIVVVAEDGRTFHLAECTYIHATAKKKSMSAGDAIQAGYTPCVRCLSEYLA